MEEASQDATRCAGCGNPIVGEPPNLKTEERKPCPKCGSKTRRSIERLEDGLRLSTTANESIIPYPAKLLAVARNLIEGGEWSISVVVSHMACEVAAERRMSAAFESRGIQDLKYPVLEFLNGFNLVTQRNRDLYTALTGDPVAGQAFWDGFKKSSKRRNDIVHGGEIATETEAKDSHAAASALVKHLKQDI
jgi:hypothetical protein